MLLYKVFILFSIFVFWICVKIVIIVDELLGFIVDSSFLGLVIIIGYVWVFMLMCEGLIYFICYLIRFCLLGVILLRL